MPAQQTKPVLTSTAEVLLFPKGPVVHFYPTHPRPRQEHVSGHRRPLYPKEKKTPEPPNVAVLAAVILRNHPRIVFNQLQPVYDR
jgi:hypothetical protein